MTVKHRVVLIHGTFAHHPENVSGPTDLYRWWQRGSDFAKRLQTEFDNTASPDEARFDVQPCGEEQPEDFGVFTCKGQDSSHELPPESVFHWSGENSETVRREAGVRLLRHLMEMNARGPFSVVAHSHGGSGGMPSARPNAVMSPSII